MRDDEIKGVIKEYLNNPKAEYAIMIDGAWGSGKTYFLTRSLMEILEGIDIGKKQRRKYAYVSLYGAKSIDEISKEIVFQYFGRNQKKKVKAAGTVMETAGNILTASLGAINIDLSKIKDTLTEINIRNWIICFDDLERCAVPVNEMLGYMNRMVEHNKCKVIVLANEEEIGKIALNDRLEHKYKVVLSGRKLLFNKNVNRENGEIDIEELKKETGMLFNENFLYKSIRENVIGLTIKYEPQMDEVYDSIISDYCGDFKKYLGKNKAKILKYFSDEECCNLRTLLCALGSIKKVYDEMIKNYEKVKYFDKIMEEFLQYIVLFTIYYRNGGKVKNLELTTPIGYILLGQNIFSGVRGFKFLEKYCTTLSFSEKEFSSVVSELRKKYEEEESKAYSGQAYWELSNWWKKEDEDVERLIDELRKEVEQNKYHVNNYQGIIRLLVVLEHKGFHVKDKDINDLIGVMNQNIENSEKPVDIERNSVAFADDPSLREQYNQYVDKLNLKADNKKREIMAGELSEYMRSDNWAKELLDYCDKHFHEILCRNRFVDLLDTEVFFNKLKEASPEELYRVKDAFKKVYGASNINEIFLEDKEKLEEIYQKVVEMEVQGITKPMAKEKLKSYLEDIIVRLEKEVYTYEN